jgi:hypothetical protein
MTLVFPVGPKWSAPPRAGQVHLQLHPSPSIAGVAPVNTGYRACGCVSRR